MQQLLCHLIGDYILQSHKMAVNKTTNSKWAIIHGIFYTLPFLFLTQNIVILFCIALSHVIIDRYRLANYVSKIKNWTFNETGYPEETPVWLTTWLMIIIDNTVHLVINYLLLIIIN